MTSKQYLPNNLPCNAYSGVKDNPAYVVVFAVLVNGRWTSRREGCRTRKQAAAVLIRYRQSLAFARKTIAAEIATQGKGQYNSPSVYAQFSYPWIALFSGRIGVFDRNRKLVGKAFDIRKLKFPEGTEIGTYYGTAQVYYPPKAFRKSEPARLDESKVTISKPAEGLPPQTPAIPRGVKTYPLSHAMDLHASDPKLQLLLLGGLPTLPLITPDTPSLTLRHSLADVVPNEQFGAMLNGKPYNVPYGCYPQGKKTCRLANDDIEPNISEPPTEPKGLATSLSSIAIFCIAAGYPHWQKELHLGELKRICQPWVDKITHHRTAGKLWYTPPLADNQLVG